MSESRSLPEQCTFFHTNYLSCSRLLPKRPVISDRLCLLGVRLGVKVRVWSVTDRHVSVSEAQCGACRLPGVYRASSSSLLILSVKYLTDRR